MTDWVQWLTLAFAGVGAAGGLGAAVISGRAESRENLRTWERDRVTERYTEFYSAVRGLDSAYIDSVDRRFGQAPDPNDDPYRMIDDALGEINHRWAETYVVARPRMSRLMNMVFSVDITVLAPHSPRGAMPQIAQQRLFAERHHLTRLLLLLPRAMRADLGLNTKEENAEIDRNIDEFLARAPASLRSPFVNGGSESVVPRLQAYGVKPLPGGGEDYRIAPSNLAQYWSGLNPEVVKSGVHGAMFLTPQTGEVGAAVDATLDTDLQTLRLRQMGRLIESGFRASPGVSGYRRISDGSRGWIWVGDSPHNLVDEQDGSPLMIRSQRPQPSR